MFRFIGALYRTLRTLHTFIVEGLSRKTFHLLAWIIRTRSNKGYTVLLMGDEVYLFTDSSKTGLGLTTAAMIDLRPLKIFSTISKQNNVPQFHLSVTVKLLYKEKCFSERV